MIGYENSNNPQRLKFSKKAHKSNMVSIKNNDYKLMWGIEGIEHKNEASNISKSGTSYKFGANPSVKRIYQNIYLPNESEETTYIASGWIYGKGNRIRENVETSIKVLVYYSDNPDQGVWIESTYTFNQSLFGWQYGALTFSLHDGTSANKQAIKMSIVYTCYGQANDIYYDNLQLVKHKVYIDDYDDKGNLIKSEGGTGTMSRFRTT